MSPTDDGSVYKQVALSSEMPKEFEKSPSVCPLRVASVEKGTTVAPHTTSLRSVERAKTFREEALLVPTSGVPYWGPYLESYSLGGSTLGVPYFQKTPY